MNYHHDFTYIRRYYGVPARRGMELIYQPRGEEPQTVRITSASGARLRTAFLEQSDLCWLTR